MNIQSNNLLRYMKQLPSVYEASTGAFWDDEHISKYMLDAHLNPDFDAASRKPGFIKKSVDWITEHCCGGAEKKILDLGCGPGIYAELFCEKGFQVTGIDFSKRSIQYAIEHAVSVHKDISYYYQNYLELDYENEFDVVTLIYCDFGVLSPNDRAVLLQKIKRALKPGGTFILDAFTNRYLKNFEEKQTVMYQENGFWSKEPYVLIQRNAYYRDSKNTLEQYLVVTEEDCACYNVWNQIYTEKSLEEEIAKAGFGTVKIFDDVTGKHFSGQSETICAVVTAK